METNPGEADPSDMPGRQQLIRHATKGERAALDELMRLADVAEKSGDWKEAATLYRDAAIAFRIDAFRRQAEGDYSDSSAERYSYINKLYEDWTARRLVAVKDQDRYPILAFREIVKVVEESLESLAEDAATEGTLEYLMQAIAREGVEFYAPGGTPNRYLSYLIYALFMDGRELAGAKLTNSQYVNHDPSWPYLVTLPKIRIGLDPLVNVLLPKLRAVAAPGASGHVP